MQRSALSRDLLRRRLASLLAAMPAAQAGDEGSVHQARVASRRLREALPVLGGRADAHALTRVERRVKRITRALGPVRELDVTLLLIAELSATGAAPAPALARVKAAVVAGRLARRRDMLDKITPVRLESLRKRLVQVASPELTAAEPARELSETLQRAGARARRLRAAIDRAGGLYVADRLHRVRVAAKKLRYALELQKELTHARPGAHIRQLKTQQDVLGRMHDVEILIDRTRGVQEGLAASDRRGMAELDALVRVLEDECRERHAAYIRARPALLKLCDLVSEAAAQGRPTAAA